MKPISFYVKVCVIYVNIIINCKVLPWERWPLKLQNIEGILKVLMNVINLSAFSL